MRYGTCKTRRTFFYKGSKFIRRNEMKRFVLACLLLSGVLFAQTNLENRTNAATSATSSLIDSAKAVGLDKNPETSKILNGIQEDADKLANLLQELHRVPTNAEIDEAVKNLPLKDKTVSNARIRAFDAKCNMKKTLQSKGFHECQLITPDHGAFYPKDNSLFMYRQTKKNKTYDYALLNDNGNRIYYWRRVK